MYQIDKTHFGPYDYWQITHSETAESLGIIPSFGGLLNHWRVQTNKGKFDLFQHYEHHSDLQANIDTDFRGPKLIPYPNRIAAGRYSHQSVAHQLALSKINDGNSIHGFLYQLPMEVSHSSVGVDLAELSLRHQYTGDVEGYPFPFALVLKYSLHSVEGLTISITVTNTGSTSMPFGDGWHPYIACTGVIDSLQLEFHAAGQLESSGRGIPTGNILPYDRFDTLSEIGNTRLDDCFKLKDDHILLEYPDMHLGLRFWQEMGEGKYNYLQVYTPDDRKSIAIEPMTCAPNAFNSGDGLITLMPDQSITLKHGVRIIRK